MIGRIGITAATFVLAASLCAPLTAQAQEFNDTQRKEMGDIIRDYLLKNPEVLREAFQELERKNQLAQAERSRQAIEDNAADLFRSEHDLVAGNPEGSITMVEYFDYNCGYCKRALPDVLKLIESDKDLKIVIKEFPILGPGSTFAARAALASRKQGKYWEFHVALLEVRGAIDAGTVLRVAEKVGLDIDKLKEDMDSSEVNQIIAGNMKTAQALGIQGTPAFLVGQNLVPGAVGFSALSELVSSVRKSGGCKVC